MAQNSSRIFQCRQAHYDDFDFGLVLILSDVLHSLPLPGVLKCTGEYKYNIQKMDTLHHLAHKLSLRGCLETKHQTMHF